MQQNKEEFSSYYNKKAPPSVGPFLYSMCGVYREAIVAYLTAESNSICCHRDSLIEVTAFPCKYTMFYTLLQNWSRFFR
jgi:hypothetical protein